MSDKLAEAVALQPAPPCDTCSHKQLCGSQLLACGRFGKYIGAKFKAGDAPTAKAYRQAYEIPHPGKPKKQPRPKPMKYIQKLKSGFYVQVKRCKAGETNQKCATRKTLAEAQVVRDEFVKELFG